MKRFWIFSLVIGIAIHTLEVDAQDAASWVRKLYAPQADTVSLIFLGDIMVHGMQLTSAKNEKGYSFLHCYEPIAPRLIKADLSIANIETAFAGPPYTGYPLFSTPEILVSELKESGIGLLLTANNHLCDQGEKGLRRSLHLFDSIGISHTGVFRSPQERDQRYPLLIGIKGIRIAFLAYSYGTNGFTVPKPYVVNLIDTAIISKDINKAKRLSPDFIIACMHWGEEYQIEPNARQKELAKFLHDSGVDIIIGAH
ncbi:MAG: CapA family protein, partial [Prevotellaceae bacterium]|nr:CapA family protein [Prevotellaceae bacterium]